MPKTISVLGSGWLGRPLAEYFVVCGYEVKLSTTTERRFAELSSLRVKPFAIDIGSLPDTIQTFLRTDTLIINIPSKNIDGFRGLLKEIEQSEIENVLFVSSTSVYASNNKTVTEQDEADCRPGLLRTIEQIFQDSGEIRTTVVRLGGLIGYNRHPGRFFGGGKCIQNPDSHVNLIHRDDCIGIIGQIVEQGIWGEIFNCCADTHPTKREFYSCAAESVGNPVPGFAEPEESAFKIVCNKKVKQALHYEFIYPDLMQICSSHRAWHK